jgi:hypothetical protein
MEHKRAPEDREEGGDWLGEDGPLDKRVKEGEDCWGTWGEDVARAS